MELAGKLVAASADGNCAAIAAALDAGARVDGEGGMRPVERAALSHHVDAVRLLLQRGASVSGVLFHVWYYSPSCSRADWGACCATADLLLAAGADVNEGSAGLTPLTLAASTGCTPGVLLLLAAGAQLDYGPEGECKPLAFAATCCKEDGDPAGCMEALLAAGAYVDDEPLRQGSSLLLHKAVQSRSAPSLPAMARVLVAAGVNVSQRDNDGRTALDYVTRRHGSRLTAAARALLAHGAEAEVAFWANDNVTALTVEQRAALLGEAAWARRGHLLRLRLRLKQAWAGEGSASGSGASQP
jgi:ankyrin repeat protein